MTRKEVQAVIDANPGKELYLSHGGYVVIHEPISKTAALKSCKAIHSVRVGTFGAERPDLARYLGRDGRMELQWNIEIVTFDATVESSAGSLV